METDRSPVAFEHITEDNGTATEESAICSATPVSPNTNDSLTLEQQNQQDSKTDEKPLKCADVSLTLSDDVNGGPVWLQIDGETLHQVEENPEKRWKPGWEWVKMACTYGVGGVIFIPIIAVAGVVSPPLLLAQKWTTGRRSGKYSAIGLGVFVGTLFLPILAPWGIYKLFKHLHSKLPEKVNYWINRWNDQDATLLGELSHEDGSVDFKIPESILINIDQVQVDYLYPNQEVANTNQLVTPNDPIHDYWSNVSDQEDANESQVERVQAFLEGLEYKIGHSADKVEEYCRECQLNDGQLVLSDDGDECGRLDTQLLCVRKVVSDTIVNAKIAETDFDKCKFAAGLCSSRCLINQRPHEVSQASRGKDTDGNLNSGKSPSNSEENFSKAQIAAQISDKSCAHLCEDIMDLPEMGPKGQGSEGSCVPLHTDKMDLPEMGSTDQRSEGICAPMYTETKDPAEKRPKKRAKRRRKKRTGEQVSTKNPTSPATSEGNNTSHLHSTSPFLQGEDSGAEKERATEVQEDKEITPEKKPGETGNAVTETKNPLTDHLVEKSGNSKIQRVIEQFEVKPNDELKRCLHTAHFNHID